MIVPMIVIAPELIARASAGVSNSQTYCQMQASVPNLGSAAL
jgi:hypothetical protein